MNSIATNLYAVIPELIILGMVFVTLLADLFSPRKSQAAYYVAQVSLIIGLLATWYFAPGHAVFAFGHSIVVAPLTLVLQSFVYVFAIVALLYGKEYVAEFNMPLGEYYVLALLSVLGMLVLVAAHNLLTLYLGVELLSLPLYAMVAMRRNVGLCIEAGMKYFLLGALASGVMLYGMSMLFGATGSLDLTTIASGVAAAPMHHDAILIIGLIFVLVGVLFKLGAAPFHSWVPDVYQGAPSSVTLFISAAPKLAALGFLYRVLVSALPGLFADWQLILIAVSIASMAIGNIVAIAQTNLRRMFAYSSIAHIGYMLLGIVAGTGKGFAAALFYMISYGITSLVAFGVITLLSRDGKDIESIEDLAGLNRRAPWMTFLLMLVLFSMAGIPPLVGFMAKVGVLEALIGVHLTWLATLAILFAIIGAYYYIRVVKVMYFEDVHNDLEVKVSWLPMTVLTINGLAVLLIGVFPDALFKLCQLHFGL